MKQSFQPLLYILFTLYSWQIIAEPVSTSYIGGKVLYAAGAGVLFLSDKAYNYYSKRCLQGSLEDFIRCRIQTRAELQKQSKNTKWYGKNLGPSCSKKVDLFVQMNTDPVPSTYEELVRFMAAHNFDDIRDRIVVQLQLYPRSEALGAWRAYQRMLTSQKQSVDQAAEQS